MPRNPSTRRPLGTAVLAVASVVAAAVVAILAAAALPGGTADAGAANGPTTLDDPMDPGVANLDPELRAALEAATDDAAGDGVVIILNSGWRSPEEQAQLLREAIAKYGSEEEAARWVATPETSAHVTGDAIDIGPLDAVLWLAEHGPAYGLCQVYANEPWHFELHPDGCPPLLPDATHRAREVPVATGSGAPKS